MGRTVPEGYLCSEERVCGDKHMVLYVQDISARKNHEKRRHKAAVLRELFSSSAMVESGENERLLVNLHKNRREKTT